MRKRISGDAKALHNKKVMEISIDIEKKARLEKIQQHCTDAGKAVAIALRAIVVL